MSERQVKFLNLSPDSENANFDAVTFKTVLKSGKFILDGMVEEFERKFAEYIGVKHCIGVGNGFDALQIILRCLDVNPGDKVYVPSNAPLPVWMSVSVLGANCIPVEPTLYDYTIDPLWFTAHTFPKTTKGVKAIISVHMYGMVAPVDVLKELSGLPVIEDCCQAHGAERLGKRVGGFGVAGAFSFYPTKNMGAYGDGGAITTDSDILAQTAREIREYGKGVRIGINSRLDELHAALLLRQLIDLNAENGYRAAKANVYLDELSNMESVALPRVNPDTKPAWHQFVIQVEPRDDLKDFLADHGIETMIHYPTPVYDMSYYKGAWMFRNAHYLSEHVLSLPIGRGVTMEDVHYACDMIKEFYRK